MKILIADKFSPSAIKELQGAGLELSYNPELKEQALLDALRIESPTVLVVRSTRVTKEMLEVGESLSLVVRAGAGVNTIDVDTASRLGVFVANCPGKNAVAVAELVMGLLVALDRKIPENVIALREGKWRKKIYSAAKGLKGKTLGLLGFGNISREVVKRARAFDMDIICWSRSLTEEIAAEYAVRRMLSAVDVARASDVVSVHLAAGKDTVNLCNWEFFAAMKHGAFFINTSRGDVVEESALERAMREKAITAALDVYQGEPSATECEWKSDISIHPQVYGTHHIGASTEQAENAIGKESIRIIKTFAATGEVLNCVNLDTATPAACVLTVRHHNRVGVLASILSELQKSNINVLEMENSIFSGDEAASAKIRLSSKPSGSTLGAIKSSHSAIIAVIIS